MAQHDKPWHVCDDCIDPLADDLLALSKRFRKPFDVAKRDQLNREYREIIESVGYDDEKLTGNQRTRRDELSQQMGAQKEPPSTQDTYSIYSRYNIDLATDWLKFNVSVDYANDFKSKLDGAKKRFSDLDGKACRIINGDVGKESTVWISYAIQRVIERQYASVRAAFPDRDYYPDPEEMPPDLRAIQTEIVDEYLHVENEFRETAIYLRHVSALVRARLAKDKQPASVEKDLLTTAELMFLVGVGQGRFNNVLSKARSSGDSDLPEPAVKPSGSNPAQHSYRSIRPFLRRNWPHREPYLPDSFDEVKAILANRPSA